MTENRGGRTPIDESELGSEVPTEDALEQRAPAGAVEEEAADGDDAGPADPPVEVDPADRLEQSREVGLDEDEYR